MHLQRLKLLPSTVKEQMYLQENTVLDQGHTRCCPAPSTSCDIYAFAKFDITTVKGMHLQKNTVFGLDLVVKVTQDIAQYPLHHVTYAHVKFEVAVKRVGRRCIYKKIHYMTLTMGHMHIIVTCIV